MKIESWMLDTLPALTAHLSGEKKDAAQRFLNVVFLEGACSPHARNALPMATNIISRFALREDEKIVANELYEYLSSGILESITVHPDAEDVEAERMVIATEGFIEMNKHLLA